MNMQLTEGFSIKIVDESTFQVSHTIGDTTYYGFLKGKKQLQVLRKEIIEALGRAPLHADGTKMRAIGDMIENEVPGMAFVLLIAEFGGPHGLSNYISNGAREDCIKWMRETADRIEKNSSFPTPEHN